MSSSIVDDDIVSSFLAESRDMLDEVEPVLIDLGTQSEETKTVDDESVNLVFRLFHSLKGGAGFLEFTNIVKVTHCAETMLDMVRSHKLIMTADHTNVLCRACDLVQDALNLIETSGGDQGMEAQAEQLVNELNAAMEDKTADTAQQAEEKKDAKDPESIISLSGPLDEAEKEDGRADPAKALEAAMAHLETIETTLLDWGAPSRDPENLNDALVAMGGLRTAFGSCGAPHPQRLSHVCGTIFELAKEERIDLDEPKEAVLYMVDIMRQVVMKMLDNGSGEIDNIDALLHLLEDVTPVPREKATRSMQRAKIEQPEALALLRQDAQIPKETTGPAKGKPAPLSARSVTRNDIRVDLKKLDHLINLVGELVIAESMVTNNPDLKGYEFENFDRASGQLDRIIRDLQDVAMSVRMIPIAGIFRKMIRLVHDLSKKAGKKINLRLVGEETEVDKTVAEQLADPLVHLIRNSVDHGIESPADRQKAGKDETGEIIIIAKHEGGEVQIVIKDDGKGLNQDKILEKAREKGLIKGDGRDLPEQEVYSLIFEPGFSTAAKVTDISGRGVGMDVVKRNIEKINGQVEIHSKPGKSTTLILRIPLTMAIIEGMLVRVGNSRFTIPILSIRESIQVDEAKVTTTMDGQEVVRVREELLPVLRLHGLFKIKEANTDLAKGLLVIMEGQGEAFCLLVDEILGEQQAVIKGLSKFMGMARGVSGCTILGDGEVSLILDVGGLLKIAKQKGPAN